MKFRLLLFLLILSSSIFSQSDVYYFKDTTRTFTNSDIAKEKFSLIKKEVLEKKSNHIYWFKIPATKTDSEYIFKILYERINDAEVYQNSKSIEKLQNQRYLSYKFNRNYDVYVRVDPKLHSYIPFELKTEKESTLSENNQLILNGFYYGFAFLVIIYNLVYYFIFKDNAFLHYSLFLLSMSFGVFTMDGMLNYFNVSENFNNFLMILNYLTLAFFSSKFANSYLFVDTYFPRLKKVSYSLGFLTIILGILYLIYKDYYILICLNLLVFSLLFIYWFSSVVLFKKNIYTKILAFAYIIILFSGIDFFIFKFFGISFGNINSNNIKIGAFVEMIILSIAVIYRMRILKDENKSMKNEILKFSNELAKVTLPKDKLDFLSNRETEIFNLIVSIKTNKEIANQLNVSVNTVKFHIKNIYEKLEVNSRKEVLTIAKSSNT